LLPGYTLRLPSIESAGQPFRALLGVSQMQYKRLHLLDGMFWIGVAEAGS